MTVTLAQLTTIRVGGPIGEFFSSDDDELLIEKISQADLDGIPVLLVGGGSNLLASDEPFNGLVVRSTRQTMTDCGPVFDAGASGDMLSGEYEGADFSDRDVSRRPMHLVTAGAGAIWDDFVQWTLNVGLSGIEALSGIPGTVGAAPVQNIGAYGHEVSESFHSLRAWDRLTRRVVTLRRDEMNFGYRTSLMKESVTDGVREDGRRWGATGRWIILDVTFMLEVTPLSAPILYSQLAGRLGVGVGERLSAVSVRNAVLEVRAAKGMVTDVNDHDTWSAGSFFTNPIIPAHLAAQLPEDAPRYCAGESADGEQMVKISAAWLIEHAGYTKGWSLPGAPEAALSTRHVLALTNRGNATATQIEALAREIIRGVREHYGITLVPEPVTVGITW